MTAEKLIVMKKFDLTKQTVEVLCKNKEQIEPGVVFNRNDWFPEIIMSFEDKEDALTELKKYKSEIVKLSGSLGAYYSVTEYYVQENTYDEDGKLFEESDVWEFSEMPEVKFE